MSDITMTAEFNGTEEMPRHLRNAAAVGNIITVTITAKTALQLARLIENRPEILRYSVERSPMAWEWWAWSMMAVSAGWNILEGSATTLSSYLRGLLQ